MKRRSIWKHHLQYIYLHIFSFISRKYIPNPIHTYLHRHPFTSSATSPYSRRRRLVKGRVEELHMWQVYTPCLGYMVTNTLCIHQASAGIRWGPYHGTTGTFLPTFWWVFCLIPKCIVGKYKIRPMDPMFFFWALLNKQSHETSHPNIWWTKMLFFQNPFPLFRYSTNPPNLLNKWHFFPPISTIFLGQLLGSVRAPGLSDATGTPKSSAFSCW